MPDTNGTSCDSSDKKSSTSTNQNLDISKEIENIEELFGDIDDDAFKDLNF